MLPISFLVMYFMLLGFTTSNDRSNIRCFVDILFFLSKYFLPMLISVKVYSHIPSTIQQIIILWKKSKLLPSVFFLLLLIGAQNVIICYPKIFQQNVTSAFFLIF